MNTVFENKESLIVCFEKLQIDQNHSTVQAAAGILRMLNDQDFNFWLEFSHHIMSHVDILYNQLQHHNANSSSIYNAVNKFLEAIMNERNRLPSVTDQQEDTPLMKKRKTLSHNLVSAKEVCDIICYQIKERFSFNKHLSAAKLLNFSLSKDNISSSPEFAETIEAYPFLCKERLETELSVLYERQEFRSNSEVMKTYKIMLDTGIAESCTEVFTLLQIILTTPMTTAEPERCFSTLKRVKSFLRSTMTQERLAALAMLSTEKEMIENIINFNDKVINKFSSCKERRMDFMFK